MQMGQFISSGPHPLAIVYALVTLILIAVANYLSIYENEDYSLTMYFDYETDFRKIISIIITGIFSYSVLWLLLINEVNFALTGVCMVMLTTAILDLRWKLVPNGFLIIIFFLGVLVLYSQHVNLMGVASNLLFAVAVFVSLLGLAVITGGGVGGADIKVFTILTLIFGLEGMFMIFLITFTLGTLVALIQSIITRTKVVAMFPAIALGVIVYVLWGDIIYELYVEGQIFDILGLIR